MKSVGRIILILIPFLIVLTSCTNSEKSIVIETVDLRNKSERLCEKLGYPDQSVPPEYYGAWQSKPDQEENFDNMKIWFDKDNYKINELIAIHVQNKNNKGYAYYPVPYVEIFNKDKNEWERLTYAPDQCYWEGTWHFSLHGYAKLLYNPYFLCADNVAGEYRFIVFCGDNHEIYSPSVTIG